MNLTDLIIIYLACGSPFGVNQVTNRKPARAGANWPRVVISFLFWPLFAISLLAGKIFPTEARTKAEFQSRVDDIRLNIEEVAFSGESISSLFEFRETFYRFVGLSQAAEVPSHGITAELFQISGHNNPSLASHCLARQNRIRLSFHRSTARNEFVEMMSRLARVDSNRIELTSLLSELASHLNDDYAAKPFPAVTSAPATPDGEWVRGLENEVWKARNASTSTIN